MNEIQRRKAMALMKCIFPPGSNQKRFTHTMAGIAKDNPELELTEKQAIYLSLLFHQYRKQIPISHKKYCDCNEAKVERSQLVLCGGGNPGA